MAWVNRERDMEAPEEWLWCDSLSDVRATVEEATPEYLERFDDSPFSVATSRTALNSWMQPHRRRYYSSTSGGTKSVPGWQGFRPSDSPSMRLETKSRRPELVARGRRCYVPSCL